MGNPKGFLKTKRQKTEYRPVCERVKDFERVFVLRGDAESRDQASRCMDCGTPFCHSGCPVGNYIPEWNDLMHNRNWERAFELLNATNNMPEVTGRVCPALCEAACVLGINDDPVTIRENELALIERAFKKGTIKANPPKHKTGKKIAIVGSGPAGLSCAAQLNQAGHKVVVFEKDEKIGGIMRFGIPDFKLEKKILDRRIKLWEEEGIEFKTGANIGKDLSVIKLSKEYDVLCLAGGSRMPRDLKVPGRELKGVYFAMDFLKQSNERVVGSKGLWDEEMDAKDKKVVVIGGGDTGSDCVGTAHRQGADCVIQIEIMPKPSEERTDAYPWPKYPLILKTTSSHEEGGERKWSVMTKEFVGEKSVRGIKCVQVDEKFKEVPGTEFEIEADLVLLALGFTGPEKEGMLTELGIELDDRGNVKTDLKYMTSQKGVFSAGDMRRGQSLIVWAIAEGRRAAHFIDEYLMRESSLPIL
ncbi:MAG: glutamate synthase subunit beta [Candidatus Margulisiibacteriota bacterium]